jgi:hypothetical protein
MSHKPISITNRLREGVLKCLTQDHRVHLKIDYRELAVEEGDQFIFVTVCRIFI